MIERTSGACLAGLRPADPHAVLEEAAPPLANRMLMHPQLSRDGLAGNAVGATKNDPAPLGHGSRHTLPTHLSFQILALFPRHWCDRRTGRASEHGALTSPGGVAWHEPGSRSPANWPSFCIACGPTRPSSALERSLFTWPRELRQIEEQTTRTKPSPKRAIPGSFPGDDGRGDLVESPEPAGPSAARS